MPEPLESPRGAVGFEVRLGDCSSSGRGFQSGVVVGSCNGSDGGDARKCILAGPAVVVVA